MIEISLAEQSLRCDLPGLQEEFVVSTARNGGGETWGSECTPRGRHRIRARIGAGLPRASVFVGRRPTGEIYDAGLGAQHPHRDWILSRILWLGGLEPGHNRYGRCDSQRRFIYIHGTNEEELLGQPVSHGCIRMANADILRLFERVPANCPVLIHD